MKKGKSRLFVERLLAWWESNKQQFPWRKESDPYRILIAEMLLRKTTARQVATIYKDFLRFFPDPKSLAEASIESLEIILKPLGMYKVRARILKDLGRVLVTKFSGYVPRSKHELLSLPGVSEYTANAVLCFAYNKEVPLVDTNVIRILYRVFVLKSDRKRAKDDPKIWRFVQEILPKGRARDFNLALIDFAHKICRPKNPICSSCIMLDICSSPEIKERLPGQLS